MTTSSVSIGFLVSVLEKAGHEYHNNGTYLKLDNSLMDDLNDVVGVPPQFLSLRVMTDQFYDYLEDVLRTRDPGNKFLRKVGAVVTKQKAKLPIQMSGLEKITVGDDSVASFVADESGPYLLSDKLDGISIQLQYKDKDDEIKAFTRGDGVYGEDISYLVKYLRLPKTSPYTNIRGEIIMKKAVFDEKWAAEYENPRNLVAGKVNSKSIHAAIHDMEVVIYGVLSDSTDCPSLQLFRLESAGFTVVNFVRVDAVDESDLSALLKDRKAKSPYELDGIVVVSDKAGHKHSVDSPAWGRKFKENVDMHEVEVTGVKYEPSKDGYLKPTIQIVPTRMGGVTVTNAAAFNHKFIVDSGIGKGAKLLVTRSGDVIPHIVEVIEPAAKTFEPSEAWMWNETGVDAVVLDPDNHPVVNLRRISFFFGTLKIEELGLSSWVKVAEAGFDTIEKIIKMTQADWKTVDGFAGRRGEIAYTEVQKCLSKVYLPSLADATGFFGRGFGTTRFEAILADHPDLMNMSLDERGWFRLAVHVNGIGQTTARQFASGIVKFIPWVKSMDGHIKFAVPEKTKVVGQSFAGQGVTFTGFRNADWQKIVEEQGGSYVDFGKKTTLLVYGGKKSGKVDAAVKKGIKVMSQGEFADLVENA